MESLNAAWLWVKRDVMNDFGIEDDTAGVVAAILSLTVLVGIPLVALRHRKRIKADILKGWRGE
ncbi:MAG TPA: hypothetical protein VD866_31470 [Urbifossiella sp.]|nr:hypothetical protein [Urbifossiella sp.]